MFAIDNPTFLQGDYHSLVESVLCNFARQQILIEVLNGTEHPPVMAMAEMREHMLMTIRDHMRNGVWSFRDGLRTHMVIISDAAVSIRLNVTRRDARYGCQNFVEGLRYE